MKKKITELVSIIRIKYNIWIHYLILVNFMKHIGRAIKFIVKLPNKFPVVINGQKFVKNYKYK